LRAAVLCASDRIPIDALRAQLAGDGIAVQEAGNGRTAWAALLQSRPAELLIVECALQGINGFDLCRLVRAHPNLHRMPIVLVCAAERLPASLQGMVDRYLAAPVETEDLANTVRELLRGVPAGGE
jgi:DNA-binding response OmpR family regulator